MAAGLATMVFCFACGSSSVPRVYYFGQSARWVVLFAVCAIALAGAGRVVLASGFPRGFWWFAVPPAAFIGLALLSMTWSPQPRVSFERAVSLGVLIVAAAALALMTAGSTLARRWLFAGLASGASAVGIAGVLLAAAGSSYAAQSAGAVTPWRFRGFGQNPNTVAVLAAVALPIVVWLGLTTASPRARAWWTLSFIVLLGSTVATESRGGLVGAFVGVTIVLGLLVQRWPHKAAAIIAFTAIVAFGVVLRQAAQGTQPPFVSAVQPGITTTQTGPGGSSSSGNGNRKPPRGYRAAQLPRRTDEIGSTNLSTHGTTNVGSGRIAAWLGALDLVRSRPLLGYGFGTESIVFVDRWYYFDGGRTENSIIGILLELGVAGLLAILALVALAVRRSVRTIRSTADSEASAQAVAVLGVMAAAAAIAFIQSYVYSVGNVATATVWITLFFAGIGSAAVSERRAVSA